MNSPIKNKTDTMGFLLMITKMPHTMDTIEIIFKKLWFKPLVVISLKINKFHIKIITFCS